GSLPSATAVRHLLHCQSAAERDLWCHPDQTDRTCEEGGRMTTVADEATTAPAKMTLPTLTALVVGSMVGAGVFFLPARFAGSPGVAGAIIAWLVAGTGMLMLALSSRLWRSASPSWIRASSPMPRPGSVTTSASTPPSATGPAPASATPSTGCSSWPRSGRHSRC